MMWLSKGIMVIVSVCERKVVDYILKLSVRKLKRKKCMYMTVMIVHHTV